MNECFKRSLLDPKVALAMLVAIFLAGCSRSPSSPEPLRKDSERHADCSICSLTFNRDIAPIVFNHCGTCHRSGEAAPFGLLSYKDVAERAQQIVEVTESRFMPPWKPEPDHGTFAGERRLSDDQVAVIKEWVAQGTIQGDPADLPDIPEFDDGWQLGQPDLIVSITELYTLPPEGTDVYRNFVIPTDQPGTRYVRAVEFRPSNRKVVHHANLRVDRSNSSLRLDQQDPGPGFEGMWKEEATQMGHLVGWHPGRSPILNPPNIAWKLEKNADLLLLLHMLPTGKSETVQFSLGLHFAETPPTRHSTVLRLASKTIDIPAGEADYQIQDTFELPVDVQVFAIRPHAHYLGKDLKGLAKLPDGTIQWLIRIKDWDFNWQDEYRPASPILLPRGTIVTMQYSYDNSSENMRNPHRPLRRVGWGPKTADEMGVLLVQLLVDDVDDLALLQRHIGAHETKVTIAMWEKMACENPRDAWHQVNLGYGRQLQGRLEEAIQQFQVALSIDARHDGAHTNLGILFQSRGDLKTAVSHFRKAVQIKPNDAKANNNLANALKSQGNVDGAIDFFRRSVHADPDLADPHYMLAELLRARGELDEAIPHYREVLRLQPDHVEAHGRLAMVLAGSGNLDDAAEHLRHVVRLRPDVAAHFRLGEVLRQQGRFDEAIENYRHSLRIQPDQPRVHYSLAAALTSGGQMSQALKHFEKATRLAPEWTNPLNDMSWILATRPDAKEEHAKKAVKFAERAAKLSKYKNCAILDTLAVAYASMARYNDAIRTAQAAVELASHTGLDGLADSIRSRLKLYRQNQPYREPLPESVDRGDIKDNSNC